MSDGYSSIRALRGPNSLSRCQRDRDFNGRALASRAAEREVASHPIPVDWAIECRLWYGATHPTPVVRQPPNLVLVDRPTPGTEERRGVEEFFKRCMLSLPGNLAGTNPLTLSHCVMGGAGLLPTILASAAAGRLTGAPGRSRRRVRRAPPPRRGRPRAGRCAAPLWRAR